MSNDFHINQEMLKIPVAAFKPIKRCQFCQSIFIDDKSCDDCGRSLQYHPIGEPFSAKSFYGIKERYLKNFNWFISLFPFLENKQSSITKSYIRKLEKRLTDLISAFNTEDLIPYGHHKLFYVECIEIINELLRYGTNLVLLHDLLAENDNSLVGLELLNYLQGPGTLIKAEKSRIDTLLDYPLWGVLKVNYLLKVLIITASVLIMAVNFKDIISSQFGK